MSLSPLHSTESRALRAERRLADIFLHDDWGLESSSPDGGLDLVATKKSLRYGVVMKTVSEGRPDRVLPLLSQAILQAETHAKARGARPLAVVYVDGAQDVLQQRFESFCRDYAPNTATGLLSGTGIGVFIGRGLKGLNIGSTSQPEPLRWNKPGKKSDLFSDLNQWLAKVLLAPDLPERLLNAPRKQYRSAVELSAAADVSPMSVSRFLRRWQEEGLVEVKSRSIELVRRREVLRRWQAFASRPSPELPMRYLLEHSAKTELHETAAVLDSCVGGFAAADLLKLGHVSGALPWLYVKRFPQSAGEPWLGLVPPLPGQSPHLMLKQPNSPESTFRGAVREQGVLVSDVLQTWLDVSWHPSRGAEQAEFLNRTVLNKIA